MEILLREIRLKQGLSYRELAAKSEVSFSQIEKIESGFAKNPSCKTMCKLAAALGVGLDDLIKF